MSSFGLLAHAAPVTYDFPLPIWLYALAGGVAVLASAPAAALAIRSSPEPWYARNLYPAVRRLRLGPISLVVCSLLFLVALVGGFGATSEQGHEFFENPATVLIWVDFWVGLGLVSTLVGDVWDFISPLNAVVRLVDRQLARRDVAPLPYPAWLGRWPALVLLLLWSWDELVWGPAKEPRYLALLAVVYFLFTLVAGAAFGAEAWLENGELFTVVARTLSRFAPLDFEPYSPEEWLARPPEERVLRLRMYGSGLRTGPPLPAGSAALVIGLLGTVIFDGFSRTTKYAEVFGAPSEGRDTLVMLGVVGFLGLAYVFICALLPEEGRVVATARRYAPTLIPIAGVYFIAHYLTYLLIIGQLTVGVIVDPFGKSWNPWGLGEYNLWKGIAPAGAVWWIEVGLIVWGHVAAIVAAHRIALQSHPGRTRVLLAQSPLVLLMVAYTMAGLWVLAHLLNANG